MGDTIVFIPDHRARAVRHLLAQWRCQPNQTAIVQALAGAVQSIENDCFSLLVSTTFTAASDRDLDYWGLLVGEPRGALGDVDYRVMIGARILVNKSISTRDEIITIAQIITAPSTIVHRDIYPACFSLDVLRGSAGFMSDARARRVARLLRSIKPAGVCMIIVESVEGYFGFANDPDASPLDVGVWSRAL
tara:strand:+ start:224 stop:796 length:573 start_codon:yes stop_codon:yes gene_type:complete